MRAQYSEIRKGDSRKLQSGPHQENKQSYNVGMKGATTPVFVYSVEMKPSPDGKIESAIMHGVPLGLGNKAAIKIQTAAKRYFMKRYATEHGQEIEEECKKEPLMKAMKEPQANFESAILERSRRDLLQSPELLHAIITHFRNCVCSFHDIADKELKSGDMRQLFNQYDEESDGYLSHSQVQAIAMLIQFPLHEQDLGDFFHWIDMDGNGKIDIDELIMICQKKMDFLVARRTRKFRAASRRFLFHCANGNTQAMEVAASSFKDRLNDVRDHTSSLTPMHYAARSGNLNAVIWLHRHGALIDSESASGVTPLMIACRHGFLDIAKYLHSQGAEIITTHCGCSATHAAAMGKHRDVLEWLSIMGSRTMPI